LVNKEPLGIPRTVGKGLNDRSIQKRVEKEWTQILKEENAEGMLQGEPH
jgi:hypothetical protein